MSTQTKNVISCFLYSELEKCVKLELSKDEELKIINHTKGSPPDYNDKCIRCSSLLDNLHKKYKIKDPSRCYSYEEFRLLYYKEILREHRKPMIQHISTVTGDNCHRCIRLFQDVLDDIK